MYKFKYSGLSNSRPKSRPSSGPSVALRKLCYHYCLLRGFMFTPTFVITSFLLLLVATAVVVIDDIEHSANQPLPSPSSRPSLTISPSPLSHATAVPSSPPSSIAADPPSPYPPSSPHTEFIPIKEWKRQKLLDIQLRINQHYTDPALLPRRHVSRHNILFTSVTHICSRYLHILSLFTSISETCHMSEQSYIIHHNHRDVPNLPNLRRLRQNSPSLYSPSLSLYNSTPSSLDQIYSYQPLETSYSSTQCYPLHLIIFGNLHTTTEMFLTYQPSPLTSSHYNVHPSEKKLSIQDEITGWADVGSIGSSMAIRKVSDFVKSFKGVSYSLASTPPVSRYASILSMNKSKGFFATHHADTTNDSANITLSSVYKSVQVSDSFAVQSISENISSFVQIPPVAQEKPFNFASSDAGARLLAASEGTIGAKNVLDNNDDKYLLTPCGGDETSHSRWIDIELSEEVILERFQTGNLEYYSSSPSKIVVLSANSYPPTQWKLLGMFEFSNIRRVQMFNIERRVVVRYLRVMFSGKQGHEFYCPISIVRVFGKNLIADWKDALEQKSPVPISSGQVPYRKLAMGDVLKHENSNVPVNLNSNKEGSGIITDLNNKDSDSEDVSPDAKFLPHDACSKTPDVKLRGSKENELPEQDSDITESVGNDFDIASLQTKSVTKSQDVSDGEVISDGDTQDMRLVHDEHAISEDDQIVIEAVHGETLKSFGDNDNIFRKVTRMLKLLELNQTLTNQFIDAQLAKFVDAIQSLHDKTNGLEKQHNSRVVSLEHEVVRLSGVIEEIQRRHWRMDVLIISLILTVGILGGVILVMSSSRSGHQGRLKAERLVGGEICSNTYLPDSIDANGPIKASRSISSTDSTDVLYDRSL